MGFWMELWDQLGYWKWLALSAFLWFLYALAFTRVDRIDRAFFSAQHRRMGPTFAQKLSGYLKYPFNQRKRLAYFFVLYRERCRRGRLPRPRH